jgi:hypothetical protein
MRAALIFLVAAFDSEFNDAPTFDPEDQEILLLDEYDSDSEFPNQRLLQTFVGNATNITVPPAPTSHGPMVGGLVIVALAFAGGGYALINGQTAPDPDYEYEYDEELLEEGDDFFEDYEYDEEEYDE